MERRVTTPSTPSLLGFEKPQDDGPGGGSRGDAGSSTNRSVMDRAETRGAFDYSGCDRFRLRVGWLNSFSHGVVPVDALPNRPAARIRGAEGDGVCHHCANQLARVRRKNLRHPREVTVRKIDIRWWRLRMGLVRRDVVQD
jgi:hypothetical protein